MPMSVPRNCSHPEYSGQVTVDGKPLAAQFKVTVTHLIVKGEKVYSFVRKNENDTSFDEGWYGDFDAVHFSRETAK